MYREVFMAIENNCEFENANNDFSDAVTALFIPSVGHETGHSTNPLYQPSLPTLFTNPLYQPSLPTLSTSPLYQPSLPTLSTNILYRPSLPGLSTNPFYQPSLPTLSTSPLYQPCRRPSTRHVETSAYSRFVFRNVFLSMPFHLQSFHYFYLGQVFFKNK